LTLKGKRQTARLRPRTKICNQLDVVILRILTPSGLFYCPCTDDEEALEVMKRYASVGWDSKVVGINAEDGQFFANRDYYIV
jgi:hypothetical protein